MAASRAKCSRSHIDVSRKNIRLLRLIMQVLSHHRIDVDVSTFILAW